MILLNRQWVKGNIEFKINGEDYIFDASKGITINEHAFNTSGSKVNVYKVYPASYSRDDLENKIFKLPKFSFAEIKVDGKLIINGFIKKQESLEFSPYENKYIDITIVTKKDFLTTLPMDFPVIGLKYEAVFDKVLSILNMPKLFTKGTMSFPNGTIGVYDGKNKTAWDMLQMVSEQSNTAMVVQDTDDGKSTISFFQRADILSGTAGNVGVPITYENEIDKKTFWNMYKIEGFSAKENNLKDVNYVRVESEKVISTRSQEKEYDLSKNQDSISTPFPIGKLDRTKTLLLNPDRTINRKLIIATNSEKKAADLIYSPNGQAVTINSRLVGKNLLLKLSYSPVVREAFDRGDKTDQLDIASRTGTNGIIWRYEKHNDMSTGADILSTVAKYLEAGLDSKLTLEITSRLPIWNIGMFVIFIGDDSLKEINMTGGYIVREAVATIKDFGEGIVTSKFTYKLVKSIDLQNDWNYYDSLARRDKTFVADEAEISESVKTTTDTVIIESVNLTKTCGTSEEQPELETDLESQITTTGNNYQVWEI